MKNEPAHYGNAPASFPLCYKTRCASAATCLRALAARDADTTRQQLTIVNPRLTDEAGEGTCPHFRPAAKIPIAYGFIKALRKVPAGNVENVRNAFADMYNLRDYYYMRRGEKPISPERQKKIAAILIENGAPEPVTFDRYEEDIDWQ